MSDSVALAEYLTLWLKHNVVPTPPHEVIVVKAIYPTVLLALGQPLRLLPTMVCRLQWGLR